MNDELLTAGVAFRGYRILRWICTGGTGEVYLARHEAMGVDHAVKVIARRQVEGDAEFNVRFFREVRIAARLRHPALVAVHDAGLDEMTGLYFVAMDYLPGGTVAGELARSHRFSITKALGIARTALEGLSEGWCARGRGIPLADDSLWSPMVVTRDEKEGIVMAVRSVGRGKLIFVASGNLTSYAGGGTNRGWWSRVLQGCGIAIRDPLPDQEKRTFDPEKLKDSDSTRAVQKTLDVLFPGWKTTEAGGGQELGYRANHCGVDDVLRSHPPCRGVPVTFSKTVAVAGKHPVLHVRLSNHAEGRQFRLRVRVGGTNVREKDIANGWTDVYVDLGKWRGRKAKIELDHLPTGWCQEWAYWSEIEIVDDASLVEVAAVQGGEVTVKILSRRMNLPRKAPKLHVSAIGGEDLSFR